MIVLDTHAWMWWASNDRHLPAAARRRIEAADEVGVAAISCWEVAMLVRQGRVELDREALSWVRDALALPRVAFLELTPAIAVRAATLEWEHRDPADRLIVTTALMFGVPLLTKDERIRSWRGVPTIW